MAVLDQQYDSTKFFLYAVNILLQLINELPVNNDVELADILEAQLASSVLIEAKKEVLSEGWDFNTDNDYEFPIDNQGYIPIPTNVLDISDNNGRYIMRDWRLYDKQNKTAIFTNPQKLKVIWDLDFNSLTHPLRNFITIRAAVKFQARTIMDTSMYKYSQQDEQEAYLVARRSDGFTGNYNMLTSAFGSTNLVYS